MRRSSLAGAVLAVALCAWPGPLHAQDGRAGLDPIPIAAIQGDGATSPLVGQRVDVVGRVTGVTATGFFLQDPLGDDNPATSDGVFVYTYTPPTVQPGACVEVAGARVEEFYAKTELNRARAISASDRCPAQPVTPVAATWPRFGVTAAAHWEALEGMLVALPPWDGIVHGPTRRYAGGEVELALLDAALDGARLPGHLFHDETVDQVPVSDALLYVSNRLGAALPDVHWRDTLRGPADGWVGVVDYHFGKYQLVLLPDQALAVSPSAQGIALPQPAGADEYTLCTYNVHGLGRGSAQLPDAEDYAAALARHAAVIAGPLQGCTLLALQETGTSQDAHALAEMLGAAYGLDYTALALDGPASRAEDFPLTNSLLVRSDHVRVVALSSVQGCVAVDHGIVAPGACAAGRYPVFDRLPLVAQIEVDGPWPTPARLWLINNHWKSKAGDEAANATLRAAQAAAVAAHVADLAAQDPVLVLAVVGDFNDFLGGPALALVQQALMPNLTPLLAWTPAQARYTYVFNGAAQALDHVLVSAPLASQVAEVRPVAINADRADGDPALRSSDHDPIWVRVRPGGATVVGGNLAAPALGVTARDRDGVTLAVAETDGRGDFRLWGLPPATLVELEFAPPPGIELASTALRVLTAAGYNEPTLPAVSFLAPPTAIWLALMTPALAEQALAAARAP